MNPIVLATFIFACIGVLDRIMGGKMKIAFPMEQGLAQCGELLIDIGGIYVIAQNFSPIIAEYGQRIKCSLLDVSTFIGCILASDMGAFPLCRGITHNIDYGTYAGTIVAGTLGTLVSFFIPIYLQAVDEEDTKFMIKGFLYGILVLPVTMIFSGLLWKLSLQKIMVNLCPVIIVCLILGIMLMKSPSLLVRIFEVFGIIMRGVICITYIWMIAALFLPINLGLDIVIIKETIVMVVKMTINVAGALVAMNLFQRKCRKILSSLEKKLNINEWSILGFFIGMPTGIAILPIFSKMDRRGKILNAAFCVSGHYMLGGQMALVAGSVSTHHFLIYMLNKGLGAILAVFLALYFENRPKGGV